jgi:hypothetical protein
MLDRDIGELGYGDLMYFSCSSEVFISTMDAVSCESEPHTLVCDTRGILYVWACLDDELNDPTVWCGASCDVARGMLLQSVFSLISPPMHALIPIIQQKIAHIFDTSVEHSNSRHKQCLVHLHLRLRPWEHARDLLNSSLLSHTKSKSR